MKSYQFGFCDWLLPLPGPTALRLAGQLGFDGVQILDLGGTENHYPLGLPWVRQAYQEAMEQAGVTIQTLQLQSLVRAGWLKAPLHSKEGQLALEAVEKGAEACQALDIPNLMVESFFASTIQNEEDLTNTAELLCAAGEITRAHGVQLIYESFMEYERTMQLWESSSRAFRLCYDILNPLRYHFGDPREELRRYDLTMIDHIHVKDAPAGYQGSCCLGTGAGLFQKSCTILKERGYTGWVVSENYYCLDPIGKEDPAFTAARDLQTLRRSFLH